MLGTWKGTYKHASKWIPEERRNQETSFTLEINKFDGIHFSGTVQDDIHTGGTRGIGKIVGSIRKDKISFIKQMPIRTIMLPDGSTIEELQAHPPIYYKGIIQKEAIAGSWKFRWRLGRVKGRIAFFPASKGSWEMKKWNNH